MKKLKKLQWILRNLSYNEDNFHRIAISNLEAPENNFERFWEEKYKSPIRPYEEHTHEEIYIKMLEDYYHKNPVEIDRFHSSLLEDDWDGNFDADYERVMSEKAKRIGPHVDLTQFQDDKDSEVDVVDNLRKELDDIDDEYNVKDKILGTE